MKILITGANGMLGEECTNLLSGLYQVIACDLQDRLLFSNPAVYEPLDVTDPLMVKEVIDRHKPNVVINCAAYTDVDGAEKHQEDAWNVNVKGVRHLVESLSPIQGAIIQLSTDYVFDGTAGPYDEEQVPQPVNFYGKTKLASEKILQDSAIPWTILRTNVLFGNTATQQASFVRWVIEKLRSFETITVVNDQYGNPTWSYALANAIARVIETGKHGLYHYAGADYLDRFQFALKIAGIYELDPTLIRPITTRKLRQLAPRPFKAGLSCEKIARELQVKFYTITEALTRMKGLN
jgi:dTDP-4-dehydrorhamnose reductase